MGNRNSENQFRTLLRQETEKTVVESQRDERIATLENDVLEKNQEIKELREETRRWQTAHDELFFTLHEKERRLDELSSGEEYYRTRLNTLKDNVSFFFFLSFLCIFLFFIIIN